MAFLPDLPPELCLRHLLSYVEIVEPALIGTNLLFLFFVSPFFTAYAADSGFHPFTTAVYAVVLLLATIGYMLFEWPIGRAPKAGELPGKHGRASWRNWFGLAGHAAAIPAAYLSPAVSLA